MKPTRAALVLLLLWCGLAIAGFFYPALLPYWRISAYLLTAFSLADIAWIMMMNSFQLERRTNSNLPINAWSKVSLTLVNQNRTFLKLELFEHVPAAFIFEGMPVKQVFNAGQQVQFQYRVKPLQRGDAEFKGLDLLIKTPLALWERRLFLAFSTPVRVYPNFAEIAQYTLLATDNRLSQMGVKRRQRRGEGSDFNQLREYRIGDSFKQIDWKATSRQQKLISREYHDERDQQIIFLVDCGRRMRHLEDGQAHLDQALNAMLLLTYVAIRQGDAVGFLSFAGTERWLPPDKGKRTVNRMLNQCYDLDSTIQAADYLAVARKFMGLQRRRALVVILSNTRAEDHSDLSQAIKLLSRRHFVVLADLQEPGLKRTLDVPVFDINSALLFHGVYDYLQQRKQIHESLQHTGGLCLDTTARELPVRLVNQYLDIKRSGLL